MTRKLAAKATAGGDEIGHSLNAVHILFLLLLNALVDYAADAALSQPFSRKLLEYAERVHNAVWLKFDCAAIIPLLERADSLHCEQLHRRRCASISWLFC
jgi:hypothetical protein